MFSPYFKNECSYITYNNTVIRKIKNTNSLEHINQAKEEYSYYEDPQNSYVDDESYSEDNKHDISYDYKTLLKIEQDKSKDVLTF